MSAEKLSQILIGALPRDLVVTVETQLIGAVERARVPARGLDKGHRAHIEGQFRHALCNEAFRDALAECGIEHNDINGCGIVIGALGPNRYARVHTNAGPSINNVSKSKTKRALARRNNVIPLYIQPDFLRPEALPDDPDLTIFFLTRTGRSVDDTVVEIVVTNAEMDLKNPVFRETVAQFLRRYEVARPLDIAHPKLKTGKIQKPGEEAS